MKTEIGEIEGDLVVDADLELRGLPTHDVVVKRHAHMVLRGMIGGDLTVEEGGAADLHGMVKGSVFNRGETLRIGGMVCGTLHLVAGTTEVLPGALVRAKVEG